MNTEKIRDYLDSVRSNKKSIYPASLSMLLLAACAAPVTPPTPTTVPSSETLPSNLSNVIVRRDGTALIGRLTGSFGTDIWKISRFDKNSFLVADLTSGSGVNISWAIDYMRFRGCGLNDQLMYSSHLGRFQTENPESCLTDLP